MLKLGTHSSIQIHMEVAGIQVAKPSPADFQDTITMTRMLKLQV